MMTQPKNCRHYIPIHSCRCCSMINFLWCRKFIDPFLPRDVCKIIFSMLWPEIPSLYSKGHHKLIHCGNPEFVRVPITKSAKGAICGVEIKVMNAPCLIYCNQPATRKGKSGNWTCMLHSTRRTPDIDRKISGPIHNADGTPL